MASIAKKSCIASFMIFLIIFLPVYSANVLATSLDVTRISGTAGVGTENLGIREYNDTTKIIVKVQVDGDSDVSAGQLKVKVDSYPNEYNFTSCVNRGPYFECVFEQKNFLSREHVYNIYLYDDSGNYLLGRNVRIITDKSAPKISDMHISPKFSENPSFNISLIIFDEADSGLTGCSGVKSVYIRRDSSTGDLLQSLSYPKFMECLKNETIEYSVSKPGTYVICVEASDFLNHFSADVKCDTFTYRPPATTKNDTSAKTNTSTGNIANTNYSQDNRTGTINPKEAYNLSGNIDVNITDINISGPEDIPETAPENLPPPNPEDAGEQCLNKKKDAEGVAELLENEVIKVLEPIIAIAFAICTIMDSINFIISAIGSIFGFIEGGCCKLAWWPVPCTTNDLWRKIWGAVYGPISGVCCIAKCGWATGDPSCGKVFEGFNKLTKWTKWSKIDPFSNIYVSMATLCIPGVIYNARKLKTIYQTYNCCIDEACKAGLSTEPCEKFLDVSTCMFYEGGLKEAMYQVAMMILSYLIVRLIGDKIIQHTVILNCVIAIYNIAMFPKQIKGIQDAMKWVKRSFDEPTCSDLGFDKYKEPGEEDYPGDNLRYIRDAYNRRIVGGGTTVEHEYYSEENENTGDSYITVINSKGNMIEVPEGKTKVIDGVAYWNDKGTLKRGDSNGKFSKVNTDRETVHTDNPYIQSDSDDQVKEMLKYEKDKQFDKMYSAVFSLLSALADTFGIIPDMKEECEKDWESSRGESDTPSNDMPPPIDIGSINSTNVTYCPETMQSTVIDGELYYYKNSKNITLQNPNNRTMHYTLSGSKTINLEYYNSELPKDDELVIDIIAEPQEEVTIREVNSSLKMYFPSLIQQPMIAVNKTIYNTTSNRTYVQYVPANTTNRTAKFRFSLLRQEKDYVFRNTFLIRKTKGIYYTQNSTNGSLNLSRTSVKNITLNINIRVNPGIKEVSEGYKNTYSYNVRACNRSIYVAAVLRGDGMNGSQVLVKNLTLEKGKVLSVKAKKPFVSTEKISSICILTNDPEFPEVCFDGIEKNVGIDDSTSGYVMH